LSEFHFFFNVKVLFLLRWWRWWWWW